MDLLQHSDGGDWAESSHTAAALLPKPYKILTETDIKNLQENDISTVSAALSVTRGVACSLLFTNRWNLHSACEQRLSTAAAVNPPPQGSTSICNICFEKFRPCKMASASCGHLFCLQCLSSYIANAINDGAACLALRCPEHGCGAAVTSDMVERFASDSEKEKYDYHLWRSYVELNPNRKWCPAPGCELAIEFEFGTSTIYDVVCGCSHTFCFLCEAESHRPVLCIVAAEWLEKNKSEAKSAAWIVSNTKLCPGKKGKMMMPTSDAGRYAHHRERWEFYENSRKKAEEELERARGRCGGGRMGFVAAAWELIVECRRVLKWSYVFGYNLAEAGLLEYLQGEAEAALERLQRCTEEEMRDEGVYVDEDKFGVFEVKLFNLTFVTRKCLDDLVVASENCLTEVGSSKTRSSVTRPGFENSRGYMYSDSDSDYMYFSDSDSDSGSGSGSSDSVKV